MGSRMDDYEDNSDSADELMDLLTSEGIQIAKSKKRNPERTLINSNKKIKILEDIIIYKPDPELLREINKTNTSTLPVLTQDVVDYIDEIPTTLETVKNIIDIPTLIIPDSSILTSMVAEPVEQVVECPSDDATGDGSGLYAMGSRSPSILPGTSSSSIIATDSNVVVLQSNANKENIIATATETLQSNEIPVKVSKRNNIHPDRAKWQKNITKEKRMRGESYAGYSRDSGTKNVTTNVPRCERKIGPTCQSDFCFKSTKRFCSKFTEDARIEMFTNFWQQLDWSGKQSLVCSLIDKVPKKQKKTQSEVSQRNDSLIYYLKLNGEKHQVCKKMFLDTFGLKERMLFNWAKSQSLVGIPSIATKNLESNRGKKRSTTAPNEAGVTQAQHLDIFFEKIPKLPSHYCRSTTSKLYLEPVFKSKSHLYNLYIKKCNEDAVKPISVCFFNTRFEELHLSISNPKKDKCDVCCGYETKNIAQTDYDAHIQRKVAARSEKDADKKLALEGKITLLCMDVQSVKVCPKLEASAIYYKTKLCCHNFTVYNMANHDVICYWWHECEGDLLASNFASCLVDFVMSKVPKDLPLVIYSDGCTCQNRNATMANALLNLAITENMTISQKYLEKGHTQMECDSVHSVIENKVKCTDIYLPHQYASLTKEAKIKDPKYEAKYLSYDFFKDYSLLQRYHSIRPGKKAGDPTVTDLRQLTYEPNGSIKYKLNFSETLKDLPCRPKLKKKYEIKAMYTDRIPLKARKWKDLQDLKAVIPKDCHSFYDALPKDESVV